MNALKTGALAITLIICIPILLGFGMATESVETTVNTETVDRNLSDLVLNSESEYYADYTGPMNNSYLMQMIYTQGATAYASAAPDYVSTGSTYTSIPTYTSGSGYYALDSGTTATHSGSAENTVTVGASSGDNLYNSDLVSVTNTDGVLVQVTYTADDTTYSTLIQGGTYYFYRSGYDSNGNILYLMETPDSTVVENVRNFSMYSDQTPTYTVYYRSATTISTDYTFFSTSASNYASITVNYTDGTTDYVAVTTLSSLVYSSTHLYLNSEPYYSVSSFGIALPVGYTQLYVTYNTIDTSSYADPSLGWTLPEPTESGYLGYYNHWTNGMVNEEVAFDIAFTGSSSIYFEVVETLGGTAVCTVTLTYSSDGTTATISGVTSDSADLGIYDKVRLVIGKDSVTVSGISAWPYIGGEPDEYNSVTWDADVGTFTFVRMTDPNDVARFRVSEASILAGTFPSTEDCTLDIFSYYPDDEVQGFQIDSVGVYGDYIALGDTVFTVTDGTITINDTEFDVLGLRVIFEYDSDSDTYSATVNNTETVSTASTVWFGGEWVFTLHRIAVSEETVVSEEWQPGEFAFDEDDFILAMIITSVAVFVALGLMKGVRIGVLLVVCSAAGIIAFIVA